MGDLIIPDDELDILETENTYEINLAIFKLKRAVKKGKYMLHLKPHVVSGLWLFLDTRVTPQHSQRRSSCRASRDICRV